MIQPIIPSLLTSLQIGGIRLLKTEQEVQVMFMLTCSNLPVPVFLHLYLLPKDIHNIL